MTANYQAIKKNHDSKRHEFEEVLAELEEAKNACQVALKQKKNVEKELSTVTKTKTDLETKLKATELALTKKEKELNDAITRITDTVADYEAKMAMKDEQIWAMGSQINECKY